MGEVWYCLFCFLNCGHEFTEIIPMKHLVEGNRVYNAESGERVFVRKILCPVCNLDIDVRKILKNDHRATKQ